MFDVLLWWPKKIWEWLSKAYCLIFNNGSTWMAMIWGGVCAFFALVAKGFDWLQHIVYRFIEIIGNFALPTFDLSLNDAMYYLKFANTILPVSETLAFIAAYVALLAVLYIYKGLKSIKGIFWAS